jgi:CubicO group peptidase (beta-lactamase class C family)
VVTDATFYPYDGQTVHNVASVTKSLMTTLIGIAADQGKLDLDDTMVSFFPDRSIANLDPRKEDITVRHLASMSSGLDCTNEADELTLKEMVASPNYVQFVLDREVTWEPGKQFVYCSPAIHLLSPILQQATA